MFEWLRKSRQHAPIKSGQRNYAAAQLSRLQSFMDSLEVAHKERLRDLPKLRAHSRDLTNNNVYAARYNELVSTNIVGPDGVNFESEIIGKDLKPKDDWNTALEESFYEWGKLCTADSRLGWVESQQLVATSTAQDGEILVRLIRGYPNKWGFAIELIDADRLDHTYSIPLQGGSRIIGGVEMDQWNRRLAYWLWSAHPSDYDAAPRRVRVPADQILHVYREDRTQGVRGIPWMTPCMVQINLVGRLWNAELLAANHEADRLGIIKPQTGLEDADDCRITAEEITSDHAMFLGLDAGQDISFPTIQHPNSILPAFTAYLLKGVASGVGVAYHSLSGDLAESKFSSDRTALIQERDHWRKLQGWFIRSFCDPIYRTWLEMALLSGAVDLSASNVDLLCAPHWDARSWDWVDPKNDVEASSLAIKEKLSTHQKELSQQGLDWEDVFRQRAREDALEAELAAKYGANPTTNGESGAVQDTALNGAQVTSLLEIINAVTAGTMPKGTAQAMILAAFPGIDQDQVSAMLSPIKEGSVKPASEATPEPKKEDSNATNS